MQKCQICSTFVWCAYIFFWAGIFVHYNSSKPIFKNTELVSACISFFYLVTKEDTKSDHKTNKPINKKNSKKKM